MKIHHSRFSLLLRRLHRPFFLSLGALAVLIVYFFLKKSYLQETKCAKLQASYYNRVYSQTWDFGDGGGFWGSHGGDVFLNHLGSIFKRQRDVNIVDVGANRGQILEFFQNASYILFEPSPTNILHIKKKIVNNKKVKLYEIAVSNFSGVSYFTDYDKDNSNGERGSLNGGGGIEVPVEMLDSFDLMSRINLLKVDAEGFDVLVLKGGRKTLERVDVVMWECHQLQGNRSSDLEAANYLDEIGFDSFQIHAKHLLQFNGFYYDEIYDKKRTWKNCVGVKRTWEHRMGLMKKYGDICGIPAQGFNSSMKNWALS